MKLHHFSAKALRDAFEKGEVKAAEIASHFIARVEKENKKLGAFLTPLKERMLLKAEHLDHKKAKNGRLGKLAGVPIAIKDNMHIAEEITTCGSKFLKNYRAPFSATAIRLLEEEDALLIGKTNMDEFAMGSSCENSAFHPTSNPWDHKRVPGGSSGGSAAAVCARMALLGTGSDTGGSIRQPAGFCGLVGFKPTYGRVSRFGLVAYGSSLDQIGPFATNVEDAALMMEVIGRHCPHDATSLDLPPETYTLNKSLKDKVFGVPRSLLENISAETEANFEEALKTLEGLGAKIIDVDLEILQYSIAVYYILATAEASTNLARFDGIRYGTRSSDAKNLDQVYEFSRKDGFGSEVKRRILLGTYVLSAGFQDAYYKKAQKVRTLIIDAHEKAFDHCDAILTPVSPTAAFKHSAVPGSALNPLEMYLQDIFTIPANLGGLPSVAVPSGYDKHGMPLSLLISGPQLSDVDVLQYAYAYEQATKHAKIPEGYE
jgi:aspartyl-tRNA(Asn)/glutamyl-tRNA(Gln) amidotransferase subunit A